MLLEKYFQIRQIRMFIEDSFANLGSIDDLLVIFRRIHSRATIDISQI